MSRQFAELGGHQAHRRLALANQGEQDVFGILRSLGCFRYPAGKDPEHKSESQGSENEEASSITLLSFSPSGAYIVLFGRYEARGEKLAANERR